MGPKSTTLILFFIRNFFIFSFKSKPAWSDDKDTFLNFPYFDGIHRFLPALFNGFGYNTYFHPVSHRARLKGNSKYGIIGRMLKGMYDIIRVKLIILKNNDK